MLQAGSRGAGSAAAVLVEARTRHGPRFMDLHRVTTPTLLHLLRREFRFPALFLLQCRLTLGWFKRSIDRNQPAASRWAVALAVRRASSAALARRTRDFCV
jgi:hypothetical protein